MQAATDQQWYRINFTRAEVLASAVEQLQSAFMKAVLAKAVMSDVAAQDITLWSSNRLPKEAFTVVFISPGAAALAPEILAAYPTFRVDKPDVRGMNFLFISESDRRRAIDTHG